LIVPNIFAQKENDEEPHLEAHLSNGLLN